MKPEVERNNAISFLNILILTLIITLIANSFKHN